MIRTLRNAGVLLCIVISGIFACSKKSTPPLEEQESVVAQDHSAIIGDTVEIPVPSPPDTVIWYSRSGCFGKCPVYSFLLLDNSQVVYSGRAYVPEIGTFSLELPDSTYLDFTSLVQNADLQQYQSDYPAKESDWVVDLPTSTIVHFSDQTKGIIRINHSPPEELKAFVEELERSIKAIDWFGF